MSAARSLVLAGSSAQQAGASNDASPTRVLSPGNGGDVSQSNSVVRPAKPPFRNWWRP